MYQKKVYTRKQLLTLNTVSSLAYQVVALICGFITPKLLLSAFGSNVNGLVNSITQFLGVVTLLDLGVGTVVQSSLYKPLADKDNDLISKIYISASRFFKRIAIILLVYVFALTLFYPKFIGSEYGYDYGYTTFLIIIIAINSFAQYYFGIVNSLLISSDQRGYIQYCTQIVTIVISTILSAILIISGSSIQIVKLCTTLVFLSKPFFYSWYVKRHYSINTKIEYLGEPIKQKWHGMAQHFASFVLTGTDNIVLTLLSTLGNVSVYSVYNLVVTGVFNLFTSFTNGFFPYFGDLWARNEKETIHSDFAFFEWLIHNATLLIFGCSGVLLVPFVRIYTSGVTDANYIQPLFSGLLVSAFAARALRLPYNYLVLAAGHYKQTQSNYIVAVILNIIISVATVRLLGLIGVAIGTLVAMLYQTVWMAVYNYRVLLELKLVRFIKYIVSDALIAVVGVLCCMPIHIECNTYVSWILFAILVFCAWSILLVLYNVLLYKENIKRLYSIIRLKVTKTRR